MIDLNLVRQKSDYFKKAVKDKGVEVDIEKILEFDKQIIEIKKELDELRAQKNILAKEKAKAEEGRVIKEKIKEKEQQLKVLELDFNNLLLDIPNPARPDVKVGKNESENEVIKKWGEIPKFAFKPKDYLTLAKQLDLIDVKRTAKVSGSRFGYIKNELALLQFAIIQYTFEILVKENFRPILPPVLISDKAMKAMGYLEHGGEEETYHFKEDNLYLVGTSEQSIGPYHTDEILAEDELPKRYVAFSTCFRREAGSYGKDTKGILRVHQFDKLEMFSFSHPDKSDQEHEFLLSLEEKLVQGLKLPYQVAKMCTGDLADPSARTYDIEIWMPSENKYRETHSTSNCTDFQARRLNIRYKNKATGKNEFVHTLNGTAFAIGRALIMILENYQQKDGSIKVPEVLVKYCGFKEIRRK